MEIGVNCGHTISGPGSGAVGLFSESVHTRYVGRMLMQLLEAAGVTVIDCTIDQANSQEEYLAAAVALANRQDLDWFISIHFNASTSHEGKGVEVYTYEGRQYPDAVRVCNEIAELGFENRGVKAGTGLYVIRKTKAKSMLIECCFCDNEQDVNTYMALHWTAIAKAIYRGIYEDAVLPEVPEAENHNLTREEFYEFVGEIARRDWQERHIMLPSVVVAQAGIESDEGKSELAINANALFGIKKNGWTGRVYVKDAKEQNPDGTYRVDKLEEWRAYDSWEQSILDHNDYINTRSTDGGKTLRYAPVIGCEDYLLACLYLEECGYATSQSYAETLVNYIKANNLTRFDVFEEDQEAPEGYLWIVQAGAYKSLRGAKELQGRLEKMGVISLVNIYRVEASE